VAKVNKNATPIFVLGTARSGTTWLANQLSAHSCIAAATAAQHHGIHESHLYSYTRFCFPEVLGFEEFISEYQKEDYYKLVFTKMDDYADLTEYKARVVDWFSELMNRFSAHRAAIYWLEKTPKHTIYFEDILRDFDSCKFVAIVREFKSTLESNMTKYGRQDASRLRQLVEKVYRYESDMKAIRILKRLHPERVIVIGYEGMLDDTSSPLGEIQRFLGLEIEDLESKYAADSSYKYGEKYTLGAGQMILANIFRLFISLVPFPILKSIRIERDKSGVDGLPRANRIDKH
jgi:hypothetical protein